MFKKKKRQSLYNSVDDSRSTVYDFTLRSTPIGFESYRTTEYTLYHKLDEAEMLPRIDDHLEKLFAGNVDDANGYMLDFIILVPPERRFPISPNSISTIMTQSGVLLYAAPQTATISVA